ncbi:MAG: hypothetical protein GY822_15310 [Deltaproteobacteria bacterium]|nr:hypothetical protein [Deltaproteobacteria bacterium]
MPRILPRSPATFPRLFFSVALLSFCLSADVVNAGPWTHAPGHGYAKIGSSTFVSPLGFDEEGRLLESDGFFLVAETLQTYVELGITKKRFWRASLVKTAFNKLNLPTTSQKS